mmetsp:Transcript_21516/g.66703  ORF Transcript_21516/g.66703 Transcript_21516/m.66703 type:complete len:377 (+) Transcript_21516:1929-3059(+)
MVDAVERGDVSQQRLRGADVGGGLIAADVLLARLHRHAQRAVAVGVHRHADDAPGHQPLVLVGGRKEGGVGATVAHGHTKALRRAHHHVRAKLTRRREHCQCKQVGRHHHLRLGGLSLVDGGRVVQHATVRGRILQQHAADVVARVVEGLMIADHHLEAEAVGARLAHGDGLRVALVAHQELGLLATRNGRAHGHRLSGGGGFIQQRRVAQRHGCKVGHHGLEVEQRLQPPLRDLRLVGRVLRVPPRVLQHVAQDHRRAQRAVVALPDERFHHLVLRCKPLDVRQRLRLGHALVVLRRQRHAIVPPDGSRHGRVNQCVDVLKAYKARHLVRLGLADGVVPPLERVQGLQGRRRHAAHGKGQRAGSQRGGAHIGRVR